MEKVLPYKCRCGGNLKKSQCEVEFFGINFGLKACEVCTKCNAEYLDNEIITKIQDEMKKIGIFGLERNLQVAKSGNSLVIRIPKEIADFLGIQAKSLIKLIPLNNKQLQVEVLG